MMLMTLEYGNLNPSSTKIFKLNPEMKGNDTVCYDTPPLSFARCDNGTKVYDVEQKTMCSTIPNATISQMWVDPQLQYNETDTWDGKINVYVVYNNGTQGPFNFKPWFHVNNEEVICSGGDDSGSATPST
jgi:hypothetical protein